MKASKIAAIKHRSSTLQRRKQISQRLCGEEVQPARAPRLQARHTSRSTFTLTNTALRMVTKVEFQIFSMKQVTCDKCEINLTSVSGDTVKKQIFSYHETTQVC